MKFIKELKEGDRVFDIYLCKHKQEAVTKNGKPYESVILQDKTGTIDAKVWEPNNPGIGDYDDLDYIEVYGDVTNFQGQLQISVKRIRVCREGEYNPSDYEDDSDIDDLDEILNARVRVKKSAPRRTAQTSARSKSNQRRVGHSEADDTFKMDVIDLD